MEGGRREDVGVEGEEDSGIKEEQEDEWVGEEEVAAREAGLGGVAPVSAVFLKRMALARLIQRSDVVSVMSHDVYMYVHNPC